MIKLNVGKLEKKLRTISYPDIKREMKISPHTKLQKYQHKSADP